MPRTILLALVVALFALLFMERGGQPPDGNGNIVAKSQERVPHAD